MIVLVTGGRKFDDANLVQVTLNSIHATKPIDILIHGNARGADKLADNWARSHGIQPAACDALWNQFSDTAGPRRNRMMLLLKPNIVVAFPGGAGTAHMCKLAVEANIKVIKITPERTVSLLG